MALLRLEDIGKIYVSEGNVSVGIRGVNLDFESGEFVAVTGKSGSGKSTLLNVISGMDTYEEGEMFIEGNPTSHYLQSDWEKYRSDYISFIFQDYNIIESFTVLENVELSLMHIEDKKERRSRALELIERVGLSSHIKQKGSKLSGGQKQRTVIARALAKDSPIILADEPTGNLDSATSKEIIELLYEVSKDKLVIVVTHNAEELEDYATRHIRIFDGAVESDRTVHKENSAVSSAVNSKITNITEKQISKKDVFKKDIKNGFELGKSIFRSKPKLSVFLCLLMIIGTIGIFAITCVCGIDADINKPSLMFNYIDGRVVLTTQSGAVISNEELEKIAKDYGAESYLHYDILLDENPYIKVEDSGGYYYRYMDLQCTYSEDFGDDIIGRYPEIENEVFLYIPISMQPEYGKNEIEKDIITIFNTDFKVTGIKYFYDNNKPAKCLFTEKGFKTATAISYMQNANSSLSIKVSFEGLEESVSMSSISVSFDMPEDKIYIDNNHYQYLLEQNPNLNAEVSIISIYFKYNNFYSESTSMKFEKKFDSSAITNQKPNISSPAVGVASRLIISDELMYEIGNEVLSKSYKQASLFFENDKKAHEAADKLRSAGYIAVTSDTTYTSDGEDAILNMFLSIAMTSLWLIAVAFLVFFIRLCSGRSLDAFKSDMAIMRSMGIGVRVIRIGMYVRMFISLIPAFIFVIITAFLVYTSPTINPMITYMYPWQYAVLFAGMILLTAGVTHSQIKRLFGESVKKSLKGGADK